MSYSRWSESRWYTFWTTFSGEKKEDQYLEIMIDSARSANFSYKQLKENMDSCIQQVKETCEKEAKWRGIKEVIEDESIPFMERFVYEDLIEPPSPATLDELEELKMYMKDFIADVEWQFGPIGKLSDVLMGWIWPFRSIGYWLWWKTRPKRSRYYKNLKNDFQETTPQEVEEGV